MSLENEPKNFQFPPIQKAIIYITNDEEEYYTVGGPVGVTKIEKIELPGPHCMLTYIRIWKGEQIFADFALHQIIGIYYKMEKP